MPTVYVVNEPLIWDPALGTHVKKLNLSPARAFGDLRHATSPGRPPSDLSVPLRELRESLKNFSTDDYLLLVGNPILIGWAVAIAADSLGDGEVLQLLDWDGREKKYVAIREVVFPLDTGRRSADGSTPRDQETV